MPVTEHAAPSKQIAVPPPAEPKPTSPSKEIFPVKGDHRNAKPVTKSSLQHVQKIEAVDGFIKIHTNDGKVHLKQAEELFALAANCEEMMTRMQAAETAGRYVNPLVKKQTMQLIKDVVEAGRKAKYQQETALRMDHKARAVQHVTDNLAWQKGGLRKERGAYTADDLPESSNVAYLQTRFPLLTDTEISGMLRLDKYPYEFRMHMLQALHGKRLQEQGKLNATDLQGLLKKKSMPTKPGIASVSKPVL